jgi:hypothetical protein
MNRAQREKKFLEQKLEFKQACKDLKKEIALAIKKLFRK